MKRPSSASCACTAGGKRSRSPRSRHHPKRMADAMANRSATLTSGGARPSWKVMAIQVVPQMATATAKSRVLDVRKGLRNQAAWRPEGIRAHHAALHRSRVHRAEHALHRRGQDPEVAGAVEPLGQPGEVLVAKGPLEPVEAREVEGGRDRPQGLLPLQVEVALEVAERELPDRPEDRLAEAQPDEVRLGHRAEVAARAEHGQHVVVVAHRLQVHEQRRVPDAAERGGGEEGAVVAVGPALGQDAAGRCGSVLRPVGETIQEFLDPAGRVEAAQRGELAPGPGLGPGRGFPSSGHGGAVYLAALATRTSARSISRRISPLLPPDPPDVRPHRVGDLPDRLQVGREPGRPRVVGDESQVLVPEGVDHAGQVADAHPDVVDGVVDVPGSESGLPLLAGLRDLAQLHEPPRPSLGDGGRLPGGLDPDHRHHQHGIELRGDGLGAHGDARSEAASTSIEGMRSRTCAASGSIGRCAAGGGGATRGTETGLPHGRREEREGGPEGHRRGLHCPSRESRPSLVLSPGRTPAAALL